MPISVYENAKLVCSIRKANPAGPNTNAPKIKNVTPPVTLLTVPPGDCLAVSARKTPFHPAALAPNIAPTKKIIPKAQYSVCNDVRIEEIDAKADRQIKTINGCANLSANNPNNILPPAPAA